MSNEKNIVRVMLVEDHPSVRKALYNTLNGLTIENQKLEVVAEAFEGKHALEKLKKIENIDLIIIDYRLPGRMNGIALTKQIRMHDTHVKILFYSIYNRKIDISRALEAGANGYALKDQSDKALEYAIQTVLGGDRHVPPSIDIPLDFTPKEDHAFKSFSEIKVKTNKHLAEKLNLAVKTVEKYCSRILEKLYLMNPGLENNNQAEELNVWKRVLLIIESGKRYGEPESVNMLNLHIPKHLTLVEAIQQYNDKSREHDKGKIPASIVINHENLLSELPDAVKNMFYAIAVSIIRAIDLYSDAKQIDISLKNKVNRNENILQISAKGIGNNLFDDIEIKDLQDRARLSHGIFQCIPQSEEVIYKIIVPSGNLKF